MRVHAGTVDTVRARQPDRSGYAVRDGVRLYWEVFGERPDDDRAAAALVDRALAHAGSCRCPTWPGTSGWSRTTRAATAARTDPAGPDALRRRRAGRRRRRGARRRRHRTPPSCVGLSMGARVLLAARRRAPGPGQRRGPRRGPPCGSRTGANPLARRAVRAGARELTRAGGRTTPTTGGATWPASPGSSSARSSRSRTRPSRSTTRSSWALETDAETLIATSARSPRRRASARPRSAAALAARCAARRSSSTATTTGSSRSPTRSALAHALGGPLEVVTGRRSLRARPAPGAGSTPGLGGSSTSVERPMRARSPTDRVRRPGRRADPLRGVRLRPDDHAADDGDLSRRRRPPVEGAGALPGPPLPGRHHRPAGQRPVRTGRSARRPTPTTSYAADALAVLDATGTDSGVPRRALLGHQVVAAGGRRRARRGCAGSSRSRRACIRSRRTRTRSTRSTSRAVAGRLRGLGRLPHRRAAARAALVQGLRRPRRLDVADRRRRRSRPAPTRRCGRASEDEAVDLSAGSTCPVLVIHGTEDRCQPLERGRRFAELDRGPPRRRSRAAAICRTPGTRSLVNTLIKEFVDMHATPDAAAPQRLAVRPRRASAARCGSARRSGSATCCATWPSPGRCASRCPTWRSSGWRSRRSSEVLAAHGEIVHPASAELASESAHWESEAERTTTCTPSTRSAVWTRSSAPTTCSSTTWCARRPTTSGSATSPGRSTTSCTRTPSARSRRTRS